MQSNHTFIRIHVFVYIYLSIFLYNCLYLPNANPQIKLTRDIKFNFSPNKLKLTRAEFKPVHRDVRAGALPTELSSLYWQSPYFVNIFVRGCQSNNLF